MDGDRFDSLARRVGTPTSRRAALGAAVAGGVLGALGLTRSVPEAAAAQGQTCALTFATTIRSGPSAGQSLAPGAQPGQLQGQLSFALSDRGSLDNATLTLADGTSLPVVGDAAGHSLQLRITLGPQRALVAIGVGEQEIARCQGAIDGLVTGSAAGELGDWHATAGQQTAGGSETRNGKKKDRANAAAGGAAGAGSNQGRAPRGGNQGGGTQGANTAACSAGLTGCGDACVNLQLDAGNCGACGQRCAAATPICSGGRCVATQDAGPIQNCAPPFAFCDGVCVNLQADPLNCGACGEDCGVNNCTGGVCGEASASLQNCAPPFAVCGGTCVTTSSDPRNCGACGVACAAGETCQQGACAATTTNAPALVCDAGLTDCGGTCVDLQTNDFHCGGCMLGCAGDQTCCGGRCVELQTHDFHCGGCMLGCAGDQTCQGGVCVANAPVCDAGLTDCGDGVCRDLQTDNFNCGGCLMGCAGDQTCQGGTCVANAPVCEADLLNDALNCGACGNACVPNEAFPGPWECRNGFCLPVDFSCPAGFTLCGAECRDLQNSAFSCGACDTTCPTGVCTAGVCGT
jgi:hypothetical protein